MTGPTQSYFAQGCEAMPIWQVQNLLWPISKAIEAYFMSLEEVPRDQIMWVASVEFRAPTPNAIAAVDCVNNVNGSNKIFNFLR